MRRLRDLKSSQYRFVTGEGLPAVRRTPRISVAPENNRTAALVLVAKHLVQHDCEAVEMTNVQWPKIGMKGIVQ